MQSDTSERPNAVEEPTTQPLMLRNEIGRLLTDLEVAAITQVKPNTLRAWRSRGLGPKFLRLGDRTARYRPEHVQEWLASGEGARPRNPPAKRKRKLKTEPQGAR